MTLFSTTLCPEVIKDYQTAAAEQQPQDCYQWRIWSQTGASRLVRIAPHETIRDLRMLLQDWLNPKGNQPVDTFNFYNVSKRSASGQPTLMPDDRRISECGLPKISEDRVLYILPNAKYLGD